MMVLLLDDAIVQRPDRSRSWGVLVMSPIDVDIADARANLSFLIKAFVMKGKEVILTEQGRPLAKIMPIRRTPYASKSRLGFMAEHISLTSTMDEFNKLARNEISDMFYGDES